MELASLLFTLLLATSICLVMKLFSVQVIS